MRARTTSRTGRPANRPGRRACEGARRAAFTLVELLLVVVIALIAAGMAVPLFARAAHSSRLRVSARAIVTSHRYARAMAVLRQADMVMMLDAGWNRVRIVNVEQQQAAVTNEDGSVASAEHEMSWLDSDMRTGANPVQDAATTNVVKAELERDLAEGVSIVEVDLGDKVQQEDQTWWVNYFSNGMCDPFSVRLEDRTGRAMTVRVDGFTGEVSVEDGP